GLDSSNCTCIKQAQLIAYDLSSSKQRERERDWCNPLIESDQPDVKHAVLVLVHIVIRETLCFSVFCDMTTTYELRDTRQPTGTMTRMFIPSIVSIRRYDHRGSFQSNPPLLCMPI